MCETLCLNFAHLGGLDNGYGRGALWVAQRQAPLPGEGLGELGRRLLAKARAGGNVTLHGSPIAPCDSVAVISSHKL